MIRSTSVVPRYQTPFSNGSLSAVADLPVEKGGAGNGFGPHELLEAAVATCMAITVRLSAEKHGYPLESVTCDVRLDRSVPGNASLKYALVFAGPLNPLQVADLLDAASRCPVMRTLTGGLSVQTQSSEISL